MKISNYLLGLSILLVVSCTKEGIRDSEIMPPLNYDTLSIEHSMKGWELYSWPSGTNWNFAILPGTNTLKNYEMVTQAPMAVTGLNNLKQLLNHFPEEEEIAWMSDGWLNKIWDTPYNNLMLPPTDIVLMVDSYCAQEKLVLMIAD